MSERTVSTTLSELIAAARGIDGFDHQQGAAILIARLFSMPVLEAGTSYLVTEEVTLIRRAIAGKAATEDTIAALRALGHKVS